MPKNKRAMLAPVAVMVACFLAGHGYLKAQSSEDQAQGVIRGTVRDSQSPLYGILVKAEAQSENRSVTVFTDENGEYLFPSMPAGKYFVSVGMKRHAIVDVGSSPVTQDFVVELGPAFLNQTSGISWFDILPGTEEQKKMLSYQCSGCHSIWRIVNRSRRSTEGYLSLIRWMSSIGGAYRMTLEEEHFPALANYLNDAVRPNLRSGPRVKEAIVRPRGEGARAVITEWNLPEEFGVFSAVRTDSKGTMWFTISGFDGALGKLDPRTGEYQTWPAPLGDTIRNGRGPIVHDLIVDKEDNVWMTGRRIMKFDTEKEEFVYWDVPARYGWNAHTGVLGPQGNYWFTMRQGRGYVMQLDPRTGEMTGYPTPTESSGAYGLVLDSSGTGTIWFSEIDVGNVAKLDMQTGEITEYPTLISNSGPRRLDMDSKGNVWFSQSFADKIGRLDTKTMEFTDFDIKVPGRYLLPGKPGGGYPYSLKVDKNDEVWFELRNGNTIGKLNPETGDVTYTLFPEPDSGLRDPSFDTTTDRIVFIYGGAFRPSIGRVYFRE